MAQVGLKDQRNEQRDQGAGPREYAVVLAALIRALRYTIQDSAPRRLALGQDKPDDADPDDLIDDSHHTIWFNMPECRQFKMGNTVALSMMSKISDALAPDTGRDGIQALKRSLSGLARHRHGRRERDPIRKARAARDCVAEPLTALEWMGSQL